MVKKIAYSLMDEGQVPVFERDLELNMAHRACKDAGPLPRQRVQAARRSRHGDPRDQAARSRRIEQLKLPQVLKDIIMEPRGLVLVVGSTGSGKSTTLASMIDHRNSTTTGHILTIEDPIEFLHKHKKSIVNQREVGLDTHAFHNALKNAMREAPDVILIGEILDADDDGSGDRLRRNRPPVPGDAALQQRRPDHRAHPQLLPGNARTRTC